MCKCAERDMQRSCVMYDLALYNNWLLYSTHTLFSTTATGNVHLKINELQKMEEKKAEQQRQKNYSSVCHSLI